jgi:hypothetical protein
MSTLTVAHSKKFRRFVGKWAEIFKLADWKLTYKFRQEPSHNLAECCPDAENKQAEVYLFREWDIEPTSSTLDEIAAHEVLHVLFAPLMRLAGERFVTEKELEIEEHNIIRVLLKAFVAKGNL